MKRYEGRDLGVPDKLIGVALTATSEGIKLDQTLYAKCIIIDGMGSTDVRKVFTALDPGMDLSPRQENKEEFDSSSLLYARILGKLKFLAGMTRPDIAYSVRELSRRVASPCMHATLAGSTTFTSICGRNAGHRYPLPEENKRRKYLHPDRILRF